MTSFRWRCGLLLLPLVAARAQSQLPRVTLNEFFSSVSIRSARLSPDARSAAIVTTRADWDRKRFRDDIWLWRDGQSELSPLTLSGHDSDPEWSPDGRFLAFISDRGLDVTPGKETADSEKETPRVWVIARAGGEAFPLYREALKVHAFTWSADSQRVLLSLPDPLSKSQQEEQEKQWKDVGRWRDAERGDLLLSLALKDSAPKAQSILLDQDSSAPDDTKAGRDEAALPKQAVVIARSRYAIGEIAAAPDGASAAFLTNSISGRVEHPEQYEIYLADLQAPGETAARQATHNQALERELHWSPDSRQLYFGVFAGSGSPEGQYRDVQGRLYAMDVASGKVQRLGSSFAGSWATFTCASDGQILALGQLATETQVYAVDGPRAVKLSGKAGSYDGLASARQSSAFLFAHSAVNEPTELYLAKDAQDFAAPQQITHLNRLFTERALPQMKTVRWKAPDGKVVEGVLLYPPGKFEAHNLRMLTLIHGGPEDADGNKFGADWYSWAILAATRGWLVFQPNYRGSTGYGDDFMLEISPHLVSVPGKDILSGVDALVKDGTADAKHLAIGGYSYGGYMTNWLITQTTRFRSAVTGAGAVEHASNWGNDDLTYDDAWYLGGTPWQKPELYQSEAAIFQFDKVKTPVHEVIGSDDIRVSASEGYLLERALDALDIPHKFLIFPGEGHSLGKDPWHGYIKVREELQWLEHYDGEGEK